MARYEVTQAQWQKIMGKNPSRFSRCGGNCPVEQVSWRDVQIFIQRLNKKSKHQGFRLPTEAEWEYACRSGGKNELYCGGRNLDSLGWYNNNSNGRTHPVGMKQPNGLGLYDMSGNVYEWCQDVYHSNAYSNHAIQNPLATGSGSRVLRGGAWINDARRCRAAYRLWGEPSDRSSRIGFRLVSSPRSVSFKSDR